MPIIQADWFEQARAADLALFTGNAIVTREGKLVMGRGLARQIRDRWPGIDRDMAAATAGRHDYGIAIGNRTLRTAEGRRVAIGVFQVKHHWGDAAEPDIIAMSVKALNAFLTDKPAEYRVVLNYPGIGNGRLGREMVEPLLADLDSRVTVVYL